MFDKLKDKFYANKNLPSQDNSAYINKRDGRKRVTDSRLRNVHDDSKQQGRNERPPVTMKLFVVLPIVGVVVSYLALQYFRILVFNMLHEGTVPHVWWRYGIGYYHNIITWFLLLVLTVLMVYMSYSSYHDMTIEERAAQKLLATDVNQAHLEKPENLVESYEAVPDNKVHFDVDITSIIGGHMKIEPRGITGKDGNVTFDKDFAHKLWDVAELPSKGPGVDQVRKFYKASDLAYNPGGKIYDKPKYNTLKDLINNEWFVPECEDPDSQNPAGVYIVSTAPENTVVVTETRGGKGQKYIEPLIDLWSRQVEKPNIVATDLKMELLKKSLRTLTKRGYNVKSLNLLYESKTDSINFIGYAADAAIRGDITRMEELITTIADIYFPKDTGDNPMWQNAASAVFKRGVLSLIDYIAEEVREYQADPTISADMLSKKADELWGQVTLYNVYQFIVQTSSKVYTDPELINIKEGEEEESKSGLTLFSDATKALPKNGIRGKIDNQDNSIRSVADSERMLASIYGIALFGMIFFTDEKVIYLTSARPSENLDIAGFSFPRRFAVKFNANFAKLRGFYSTVVEWSCYTDPALEHPCWEVDGISEVPPKKSDAFKNASKAEKARFEKIAKLKKDFTYQGSIDIYGWADSVFKGIFKEDKVYLQLKIYDAATYNNPDRGLDRLLLKTYQFEFKKGYRMSYTRSHYLRHPVTGEKEVMNGSLSEYEYDYQRKCVKRIVSTIVEEEFSLLLDDADDIKKKVEYRIIENVDIHYAEKPTALFLVAPPNLAAYNKVLLITIDMIYGQQTALSYKTLDSQKPFYPTKYLLDEFGNIQSEGKGVSGLDMKLTSGLGQDQQFTLILQSMKQLSTLYGDDIAQTLQSNVKSFLFMSSKDEDVIGMMMDMAGTITVPINSSFSIEEHSTEEANKFAGDRSINKTFSRDVQPVIPKNDFLLLNDKASDGNAIVVGQKNPIWSIGSTVWPMSYMLLSNRTGGQGEGMIMSNLETMASTAEFDSNANLPRFEEMISKRVLQAKMASKVIERYKRLYNVNDEDIQRLDQDLFASQIMLGIMDNINRGNTDMVFNNKHNNDSGEKGSPKHMNAVAAKNGTVKPFDPSEMDKQDDIFSDLSRNKQEQVTKKRTEEGRSLAEKRASQIKESARHHVNNRYKNSESIDDMVDRRKRVDRDSPMLQNVMKDLEASSHTETNPELNMEMLSKGAMDYSQNKRYADGLITRADLVSHVTGVPTGTLDFVLARVYQSIASDMSRDERFVVKPSSNGDMALYASGSGELLIDDHVDGLPEDRFEIKPAFAKLLVDYDSWASIANGRFEREFVRVYEQSLEVEEYV